MFGVWLDFLGFRFRIQFCGVWFGVSGLVVPVPGFKGSSEEG